MADTSQQLVEFLFWRSPLFNQPREELATKAVSPKGIVFQQCAMQLPLYILSKERSVGLVKSVGFRGGFHCENTRICFAWKGFRQITNFWTFTFAANHVRLDGYLIQATAHHWISLSWSLTIIAIWYSNEGAYEGKAMITPRHSGNAFSQSTVNCVGDEIFGVCENCLLCLLVVIYASVANCLIGWPLSLLCVRIVCQMKLNFCPVNLSV